MNIQTNPAKIEFTSAGFPGVTEAPIRSNFLPEDRLRVLGAALAKGEVRDLFGFAPFEFQARIRDSAKRILEVYRSTNAAQAKGETITPAAQWLLDNNYLVEETIFQVKRDLPRRFYRQLPTLRLADGTVLPRAFVVAWSYVEHSDSAVSATMFKAIVEGFQSVEPLKIGELWALPSLLRFVLIENLRRIAVRVERTRQMRHIANEVADRVLATDDNADRTRILSTYAAHAQDTTFATQLLYRLRDGSQNAGRALEWLEGELEKTGSDAEEIIISEHQTLSSGNVTTGNIIRGLRLINDVDWTVWFEGVSRIDTLLREKTDFAALDFFSRDQYRTAIEQLARRSDLSEFRVAEKAIELAGHVPGVTDASGVPETADPAVHTDVGFFLVGPRRPELEQAIGYRPPINVTFKRAFTATGWLGIVVPVFLLTVLLLVLSGNALANLGLSAESITLMLALFAVPASEGALAFFNTVMALFLKPTRLVGYDYKHGIPAEARTLVVVPSLIGSRDDVEENIRNIEVHHLANTAEEIHFALLSDWPDSKTEIDAADIEILQYARDEIARLNARYPSEGAPRFYLLHRRRLYNQAQGCWMGWERKRGKLHELNLLVRGDSDTTFLPLDVPLPDKVTYVMTLDADTRTTRDAVSTLVGKLAHPLNRPHFDPVKRVVTAGYTILQPRITASLTSGDDASFFQRVFSANRGLDPYVFAVSDVYQDVFGDGSFTGKGLYHVDAFEAALKNRIEENTILSHDLLEGALSRAALVTDVELVEDYPTRYSVDASRHHRWARGDWQLLGFMFDPRSGVPALSRWKMVDNLRRSLTPIFWVMACIAGWTLLPFTQAAQWQALLILSLFMAPTFDIVNGILPKSGDQTPRGHFSALARDTVFGTALVALKVLLMAHLAWMMGDAIIRTLYRLFVSRQNLLEWRTASQAHKSGGSDLGAYYSMMYGAVIIGVVGLAIPVLADSTGAFVAFFFAIFWIGSPAVACWISRSAETEDRLRISASDIHALRTVARRTWHYFETFVTAEHHHLPPDNFQESPAPVVAPRTSPTNIGVYLLSVVSARDFGWISLSDAITRIDATMTTIESMPRDRGHLYNWYDTTTLKPLYPLYISAVDSGNLAGHLVAVAAACAEWAEAPSVHLQGDFEGILDTVTILDESLEDLPDDRRQLRPLRQRLADRLDGMRRAVMTIKAQPEMASIRTINLAVLAGEIRKLATAIHVEAASPKSDVIADWAARLEATCEAHVHDSHNDESAVTALRTKLLALRGRCRRYAFEMEFSFLMRQERKLLSIGYRVEEHQLDESCYDLLASEARLTSLFAIAKGDLPTEHWFRLGRPIVEIGFKGALMSWSGSMFEYLMPPLVMKEPQGSILNQTSKLIIKRQIQYARSKNVPWGISEAAYNARDRELTYQYTNFGVPGLGLKRGLGQNTVIAPYATILAAQFYPREAVQNLMRLRSIGALGRHGYYDAVDFTPQRVPEGTDHAVVHNYMAHHSGMSIAAVADAIFEGRLRERFHSDPVIESAELLLQEKAPRDIPAATVRTEADERAKDETETESPDSRIILDPIRALRATNVMSNGRYSVMVSATGSGYSRFGELAVTRWQPDPSEDRLGSYIFLRDTATGDWWSATAEPKRAENERVQTLFADDKASFTKSVGSLRSEVECIVISEGNGEGRRITLYNDGATDRHIEVTSFAELVLGNEASDNAHPLFSKMFVETEIAANNGAIFATRRKRDKNEPDLAMVHFVTDPSGPSRDAEAETDRRAFIGRGRTIADAAAFDPGARLSGGHGFTLDPVAALRRQVRVPANKKISLTFWTIVGANRGELDEAMGRLDHQESFARQAMLAWTRSQVQTRHLGLSLTDAANVQTLARYLIYPDPFLRLPAESIASGLGRQSSLWPTSISGDFPIFLVRIGDVADLEIVAQALRFQEYMRARGMMIDFVVVNEQASSYVQDLQRAVETLCENSRLRGRELGPRQHIFAVRRDLMDEPTYKTLLSVARVVLHTRNGTIFDQLERAETAALQARDALQQAEGIPTRQPVPPLPEPTPASQGGADIAADGAGLSLWNGFGGFDGDGRHYVTRLTGRRTTPQPWINVISNASFGFHVSAEGSGFTWSRNSRDYQLTPWSNDPVSNRPGEGFYIYDQLSGKAFSPMAAVVRDPSMTYETWHGQGFSTFRSKRGALSMDLTQVVDPVDPVKITRLRIQNSGPAPARLRVYAYAEWVLGGHRSRTAATIVPTRDAATGAMLAQNPYGLDFGERVAFLAAAAPVHSVTADRTEFIGRHGTTEYPQAVLGGLALSGRVEAGDDPCAVIANDIDIPAGGDVTLFWLLGDAATATEASALVQTHRGKDFDQRLADNERVWRGFLDTIQVETPDKALNAMVNHWLPYQSLACRIRARSAFYQASGAFGFRDQLQDTLALLAHDPKLARDQILNAARRQFPEGDVQHWWLPRTDAGVRTMISDDVVWLAHATARYIEVTGDVAILKEQLPFIDGQELGEGEHDAFFTPEITKTTASLYDHCARALDLAIKRSSPAGLPLILGGDWNDGMNRVGEGGKGESVWLGWFLLKTLGDFAPVAKGQGDAKRAQAWTKHADLLKRALESTAWDGQWYRRGSFDDGAPLGSRNSDECKIDSIAQSWSVLSGEGDPTRSTTAMEQATRMLVDDELQIVKLFTPPFSNSERDPGYIRSYPPGVRENGGQYTHAATWFVIALAEMGRTDEAYRCFSMLNPVNHASDEKAAEHYRVEPYVVAADIYAGEGKGGRGGWTWYTGSAGWLYRAAVEGILGIERRGKQITFRPKLPGHWDGYAATLKMFDGEINVRVIRDKKTKSIALEVNGSKTRSGSFEPKPGEKTAVVVKIPA
ncbi:MULTISPECIES: glucoamylase family protein [unclassified Mesorhizobium]|uniref:GH36-type glycosyl hydrolase domain-containing protein n=1 Tax=unclassified Mesorhizobium TaxID=325217 RepID=UPI000FCC2F16|nr:MULTISPECIES: glucoamylase family protein [unclassified Mesorhizobium]TGP27038.1 protein ndvB [Mesorhizobium sp. M1D.F.Ca.ET.231.01.1.1]TGP38997.1 protein ndvB [Mesorhizobium sp. M1D.F.Ca.ET.234.01.1.1]TGS51204.1 protein ndvB [Mesorhizobium sp. M1D.F.Ca.ET.184.01.1.1]TGS67088.1 protein ndvB [Mesorhizobium sp. M1D.F.Ca.ET.183.01.1.1]